MSFTPQYVILMSVVAGLVSSVPAANVHHTDNLATCLDEESRFTYHNHSAVTSFLQCINQQYPDITALDSIGTSVQGRELWRMRLAADPHTEVALRPDLLYIGNIHGDEVIGHELVLQMIDIMTSSYGTDERITALMDNTQLHVVVSMNPDGFELAYSNEPRCFGVPAARGNANGYDLNRNFPDPYNENDVERQPETLAVMGLLEEYNFVLGGNMHGGEMVINFPHDSYPGAPSDGSIYAVCTDDDVFRYVSLSYTWPHEEFQSERPCDSTYEFGITNGADWYPVVGGLQDYAYTTQAQSHVTMELHCCKYPDEDELQGFWQRNQESLIRYLETYNNGVKGIVEDTAGQPIEGAVIGIQGRDWSSHTKAMGQFFRLLLPGTYTLTVAAEGYMEQNVQFEVINIQEPTTLTVTLEADLNNKSLDPK